MSDYPRPQIQEARIYRPDRIVGWLWVWVHVGNLTYWLYRVVSHGSFGYYFRGYPLYGYGTIAFTALLMGLFAFLAQSRRGAFVVLFWLLGLMIVGVVVGWFVAGRFSPYSLINVPAWVYCIVRLLGLLGPKPVRGRAI